jgi:putative hydrolase of the HAD superfamily
MIRAVGFDLDNTLYDQTQHVFPFFSAAAAHLGEEVGLQPAMIEKTFREAWHALGPSHPKLIDNVLAQYGILDPQRVRMLVQMYRDCISPLELYDGVQPLLERLCRRFPLFLITDGNEIMQRRKIERLGIGPLFRVIVFSVEQGPGLSKPHPAPFLNALRQLKYAPGECLFAGDNPRCDIAGAARVGMKTVRVLTGPFRAEAAARIEPDFTMDFVAEIEKVLR